MKHSITGKREARVHYIQTDTTLNSRRDGEQTSYEIIHSMISDDGNSSTSFKPFAARDHIDEDYEIDIPTPAPFVEVSLQQLKEKLANVEQADKSSLVHAQQISLELVNDEHLLGFLYAEKFDVDVSRSTAHHRFF